VARDADSYRRDGFCLARSHRDRNYRILLVFNNSSPDRTIPILRYRLEPSARYGLLPNRRHHRAILGAPWPSRLLSTFDDLKSLHRIALVFFQSRGLSRGVPGGCARINGSSAPCVIRFLDSVRYRQRRVLVFCDAMGGRAYLPLPLLFLILAFSSSHFRTFGRMALVSRLPPLQWERRPIPSI
jgi:hypothetical protein